MQLCVGKEMNNLHVPVGRMSGNLPPPSGCLVKMLQLSVVLYDVVMYDDTLYVICNVCVFLIFGIFCVCGFLQLCLWLFTLLFFEMAKFIFYYKMSVDLTGLISDSFRLFCKFFIY